MNEEKDKYDRAIEILLTAEDFKKAVSKAWFQPNHQPSGCLFQFVQPNENWRKKQQYPDLIGCLTTIRGGLSISGFYLRACTDELDQAIRADERIPTTWNDVTPENLSVFAEWQRKIDREVRIPYEKGELDVPNVTFRQSPGYY